jgi:hypothetical protein
MYIYEGKYPKQYWYNEWTHLLLRT